MYIFHVIIVMHTVHLKKNWNYLFKPSKTSKNHQDTGTFNKEQVKKKKKNHQTIPLQKHKQLKKEIKKKNRKILKIKNYLAPEKR